jgi:hypothetical protein
MSLCTIVLLTSLNGVLITKGVIKAMYVVVDPRVKALTNNCYSITSRKIK